MGLVDGVALVLLSIAVIAITRSIYHWIKGKKAQPLGIALSLKRGVHLLVGLLIGFAFAIAPYVGGLLQGTALVHDRITEHFDGFTIIRFLIGGFLLLLLQSVMEETANRAFPMRLWAHRSLLFAILVPSIFFAALHLADEQFNLGRISILLMAGIIHSLAYALTGNVWFTSGLHTGANFALFSISGLWHAGAIVSVVGQPSFPNWLAVLSMLITLSVIFLFKRRSQTFEPGS